MSANACPRCAKALSARDQGRATCPFCSASLKGSAARSLDPPPAEDEGYASIQVSPVNAPPPPSPKLAAPGLTPASPKPVAPGLTPGLTATARNLRSTMVGAAVPFALSPPLPAAPARTAASAAPVAATAAALAPAIRTPAPVVRTPAPVVRTPAAPVQRPAASPAIAPPPAPPARDSAIVTPLAADSESEPTHVMQPSAARSTTGANLLTDSDSDDPTHVREPGTVTPSLTFPDSDPIASVTMEPDEEPPVVSGRILLPPQPRRGLALVGLGMGLAIVGVAVAGVKLLGSPKATPAAVSTQTAPAPAEAPPIVAAIEPPPPRPAPPPPIAKAPPPPRPAPPPAKVKAVPATIAHVAAPPRTAAPPRVAAPVEERRATGRHSGKGHQRQAARARKVAMKAPAAKRNATPTPTPTPERGDPRPHYERGNALLFAGDSKGAIAAYREAIRAAPADPSAFRGLGLAYEQQSEPVFAARALRRYLKLAPNAQDHDIVARRLERLSRRTKK